jgi:hypothetical protein
MTSRYSIQHRIDKQVYVLSTSMDKNKAWVRLRKLLITRHESGIKRWSGIKGYYIPSS